MVECTLTSACACVHRQGNWNDFAQIRSKITQDLLKSVGGLAPRIEYARLSVNGEFFGLYSIEESLKEEWASCFGMDMEAELPDRNQCQDVEPSSDSLAIQRACAEAGPCTAQTFAVPKGICRPANTGAHPQPQCQTEIPWLERDHCSWDGRCDTMVQNTDPESPGYFCHDSEQNCRGPCTAPEKGYSGTWCPGRSAVPPLPEGQCPPGCIYSPPVLRCDSAVLTSDPLEVAKSTILKNDHGGGGVWPESCGHTSCADGFERKEPSCTGCDNDFLMRNNPVDHPQCDCDAAPQLDALFRTLHSGDKRAVQSAMNMTSVFAYQAFAVLVNNGDTGAHNYYLSKVVEQPWRIINVDPDWSFGHGFSCRGDSRHEVGCTPAPLSPRLRSELASIHDASRCRENGGFDNDCCAVPGSNSCAAGYILVPTTEDCFQNIAFRYFCVPPRQSTYHPVQCPNDARSEEQCPQGCTYRAPVGDPTDASTVKRVGGQMYCPYVAEQEDLYGSNQRNNFMQPGGPLNELFEEEYLRWFHSALGMPQLRACAVTDAAEVLLHPDNGIIREAFDEDRHLWHRDQQDLGEMGETTSTGDIDEELAFFQAWTRLRFASLTALLDRLVAQYDARRTRVSQLYPLIDG
eukprot:SAG31_NODE_5183_length_2694_cov_6.997494_1_plen_630_part_10